MNREYVRIKSGSYRNDAVKNIVFPMVKQYQHGANGGFVTVDGVKMFGPGKAKIRVKVDHFAELEPATVDEYDTQVYSAPTFKSAVELAEETDDEVIERISSRFSVLQDMAFAACAGQIKAMIVTGGPGCGKSWTVESELEKASLFDLIGGKRIRSEVIKGGMTAIGLYQKLFEFSDRDNVLVMDDVDQLFYDDLSLNLLKAALDTSKRRKICWNGESYALKRESIPDSFDFKGSIIFITNLKFENIKSKKLQDHLMALESRCHYLDLTLDTTRDKLLRIKQIFQEGELFNDYDFDQSQQDEIMAYLFEHHNKFREISLRTAIKLAELYKSFPSKWKDMAKITMMVPQA